MHIIEVTDPIEARRAKNAQYSGHDKTLTLAGQRVAGLVQSVSPDQTAIPLKWVVTIRPSPNRKAIVTTRR